MKKTILALLLAALLALSACGSDTAAQEQGDLASAAGGQEEVPSASGELFAMDTYMTVTCYGQRCQEALEASLAEIQRLDDLLSIGSSDSEISLLNAAGTGTLSADTAALVEKALELYSTTQGAFDMTVYPLMELWGFPSGDFSVPDSQRLEALLAQTGSGRLTYDRDSRTLTLGEGQGVDLGGIAKGYTSGRIMELFEEYGLEAGVVSLGGNVQCYSTKVDGSLWRVGIQNPLEPEDSSSFLGVLSTADRAVITSGGYERYFVDEETGETYHHILDPRTGYPADSGLISVTIVSENGTLADGLSTACYVMGLEESISYWREYGEDFDMILMTEEGQVYVTQPLEEAFTSSFPVTVIQQEE